MKGQKQLHSKSTDTPDGDLWYTPRTLIEWIETYFIEDFFRLDAAACKDSAVTEKFITAEENALDQKWAQRADFGWIFCNPPYSLIKEFTAKMVRESLSNHAKIVALVPARTDTKWFADLIDYADDCILIGGRIKFWNPTKQNATNAPFPSALVKLKCNLTKDCNIRLKALHPTDRGL